MDVDFHFTEQDWQRLERDWSAWWAGELDRPLVMIEGWEPPLGQELPEAPRFVNSLVSALPAEQVLERYEAHLQCRRFYGAAWPKWHPNFGPGIIAGFLGANVRWTPETVWFQPSSGEDIAGLNLRHDDSNVWWQRVREITCAAVERWGPCVSVSHADIGGNLDILASLRGTQQLLLDLYDAPDEVARLLAQVTDLWLLYYDQLHALVKPAGRGTACWAPIWSPGRGYILQSDFSYMISPRMFERFVLPDIATCCEALDQSFYHMDGQGQIRHLDLLLSLERLGGIQWIPGAGKADAEGWLPLLARIRQAGKLCQVFVTPEGAHTIVRALGGRGFAFFITAGLDQHGVTVPYYMARDDAEALIRALAG